MNLIIMDPLNCVKNISLGHVVFEYCNFQEKDKWCQPKRGENGVHYKIDTHPDINFSFSKLFNMYS